MSDIQSVFVDLSESGLKVWTFDSNGEEIEEHTMGPNEVVEAVENYERRTISLGEDP